MYNNNLDSQWAVSFDPFHATCHPIPISSRKSAHQNPACPNNSIKVSHQRLTLHAAATWRSRKSYTREVRPTRAESARCWVRTVRRPRRLSTNTSSIGTARRPRMRPARCERRERPIMQPWQDSKWWLFLLSIVGNRLPSSQRLARLTRYDTAADTITSQPTFMSTDGASRFTFAASPTVRPLLRP